MEIEFKFSYQHSCSAAVVCCVDFRFIQETQEWVKNKLGIESFDLWTVPGCAKLFVSEETAHYRDFFIQKLKDVSRGLHSVRRIIIINHADCGAYGGRKSFETPELEKTKHLADLKIAKEKIYRAILDVRIETVFADLDKKMERISFEEV